MHVQTADDTSFNRLVLKATLPTIALFIMPEAEDAELCLASITLLAERYAGCVQVLVLDAHESPLIVASFGVQVVAAYLLFRDGELMAHRLGYLPVVLLDLFFQLAETITRPLFSAWQPSEQAIEDYLIIPMLERWGWTYARQYGCKLPGTRRSRRGVVDLLVFAGNPSQPLTLFENKRQIRDHVELQRAVDQAHGYALALRVRSLVVMDASQLWIYQIHQGSPVLAQQVAIAQLEQHDQHVRDLLLALGPVFDPIEAF